MKKVNGSHVALETRMCPVCGEVHKSGALLLDRRMQNSLPETGGALTGYDLCPEHQKMWDDGFVALVEAEDNGMETVGLEDADRTGRIAHVKATAWERIFNMPPPDGPMAFVQPGVLDALQRLVNSNEDTHSDTKH
jgi:hypothetical protein